MLNLEPIDPYDHALGVVTDVAHHRDGRGVDEAVLVGTVDGQGRWGRVQGHRAGYFPDVSRLVLCGDDNTLKALLQEQNGLEEALIVCRYFGADGRVIAHDMVDRDKGASLGEAFDLQDARGGHEGVQRRVHVQRGRIGVQGDGAQLDGRVACLVGGGHGDGVHTLGEGHWNVYHPGGGADRLPVHCDEDLADLGHAVLVGPLHDQGRDPGHIPLLRRDDLQLRGDSIYEEADGGVGHIARDIDRLEEDGVLALFQSGEHCSPLLLGVHVDALSTIQIAHERGYAGTGLEQESLDEHVHHVAHGVHGW